MLKLWIFLFIYISLYTQPVLAQNQELHINTSFSSDSGQLLGLQNNLRSSDRGNLKLGLKYDTNNLSSYLALNYDGYNNFTLDGSYLQYTSSIATFGMGAIDRHWSFSNKTSLILSHNARPFKSVYIKLKNGFKYNWLPSKANWSFEMFNGLTKGSLNNGESMLLGARAIFSPIESLKFELVQTSQWGGNDYNKGISALGSALLFDTNNSSNANINKMAGFGVSYLVPSYLIPLRIYGQAVGEDEAGNLPSCFGYFAGLEWSNTKIKYPIILGIETVNTRIDHTTNGNCGPNTMYNNTTYDYTNHGDTMGAAIDTEGNSLEFFGSSQISQKTSVQYSVKYATINDNNFAAHRLSSKKKTGVINTLSASWSKNNISLNGNIYYQGFSLEKAKIKKGYGFGFSSSIKF